MSHVRGRPLTGCIMKARARKAVPIPVPDDLITPRALQPAFLGGTGLPDTADSLAYDPVQRLLAVGTSDGRVAVFGREGVEFCSEPEGKHGTEALRFLQPWGSILRLTKEGDVQIWGMANGAVALVDSIPCADCVTAVAPFAAEPYVVLGCESGTLQVLGLTAPGGAGAGNPRGVLGPVGAATSSAVLPYEVRAEDVQAAGPVLSLDLVSRAGHHRLLVVYGETGTLVWDVRHKRVIMSTDSEPEEPHSSSQGSLKAGAPAETGLSVERMLREVGPENCACWVGAHALRFATGHQQGDILLWQLPQSYAPGNSLPENPAPPMILSHLRAIDKALSAGPVLRLTHVPSGAKGADSSEGGQLLVLGGQSEDEPAALSLVPLTTEASATPQAPHSITWFGTLCGYALVPTAGSVGSAPSALVTLSESSQLMVFELEAMHPMPLALPFQELGTATVSVFKHPGTAGHGSLHGNVHVVTLNKLRAALREAMGGGEATRGQAWRWGSLCNGGRPPGPREGDILLTGHVDGRIRCWDMSAASPVLLATVPFNSGGPGTKLRKVCAMQADMSSGLLAVAHDDGELRLYQFCSSARELSAAALFVAPGAEAEMEGPTLQPPGWQLMLKAQVPLAAALALAPCAGLLGCVSAVGEVHMIDVQQPAVLYRTHLVDQALVGIAFACIPDPSLPWQYDNRPAAIIASADSGLLVIDARSGEPPAPLQGAAASASPYTWLRPKHSDTALGVHLLDALARPLHPASCSVALQWALAGAAPEAPPAMPLAPSHGSLPTSPTAASEAGSQGRPVSLEVQHASAATCLSPNTEETTSVAGQSDADSAAGDEEDADEAALAAALAAKAALDEQEGGKKKRRGKLSSLAGNLKLSVKERQFGRPSVDSQGSGWGWGKKDAQRDPHRDAQPRAEGDLYSRLGAPALHIPPHMHNTTGGDSDSDSAASGPSPSHRSHLSPAGEPSGASGSRGVPTAFILLASRRTLRLYAVGNVITANRSTLYKTEVDDPLICVAPFVTRDDKAPGLVCLSANGVLQVLSLPRLLPQLCTPLNTLLGFPFSFGEDPIAAEAMQRALSVSPSGQLALISSLMALTRVGVSRGDPPPNPPTTLWDSEIATATAAASSAALRAFADAPAVEHHRPPAPVPQEAAAAPQGSVQPASSSRKSISSFFTQAISEGTKNADRISMMAKQSFLGLAPKEGGHHERGSYGPPAPLPSLGDIFNPPPASEAAPAAATQPGDRRAGHLSPSAPATASGDPLGEDEARSQLFGGARKASGVASPVARGPPDARAELLGAAASRAPASPPQQRGPGGMRSADEIKLAYSKRTNETSNVMAENQRALAERGERLQNIGNRSEQMADAASDFASLARQLRDQQANKKWYQF
ncbi:hypothetical protein WJX73_006395 [Symbiochloris irregularis]|uniref:V-SNARE coiled-coil homology domain-containing protein n=1 Tax=Symbiochloris irregularis TaxID=706552 RepID=A0AAW1NU62_9CHLO